MSNTSPPSFVEGIKRASSQISDRFDGLLQTYLNVLTDPLFQDDLRRSIVAYVGIPILVKEDGELQAPAPIPPIPIPDTPGSISALSEEERTIVRRQYVAMYIGFLHVLTEELEAATNNHLVRFSLPRLKHSEKFQQRLLVTRSETQIDAEHQR